MPIHAQPIPAPVSDAPVANHSHDWHEFYATSCTKLRECYGCGGVEEEVRKGIWKPVE